MSFELLGLTDEADEREVRRTYARLLKLNRPDDDPAAFQALHEAYQDCLAQLQRARWQEGMEKDGLDHDYGDAAVPARTALPQVGEQILAIPTAAPDSTSARPEVTVDEDAFDLHGFMTELFDRAIRSTGAELMHWLHAVPELYSIRLKSAIAEDVLIGACEQDPPLPGEAMKSISDFFGADQLGPRSWWLVERLQSVREQAEIRHRFRVGNLPHAGKSGELTYVDEAMERELVRPGMSWRSLTLALMPGGPGRMRDRILELDGLTDGLSTELINPRLRATFLALTDRSRVSLLRFALTFLRTAVFGGTFLLTYRIYVGEITPEILDALFIAPFAFIGWQILTAAYLGLKRTLVSRGLGGNVREIFASTWILLALAASLMTSESSVLLPYALAVSAYLQALTRIRIGEGVLMIVPLIVLDSVFASPKVIDWPLPKGIAALCLAATSVLVFDRIRSFRSGLPVDVLAQDNSGMRILRVGAIVLMIIGLLIASALVQA